MSSFKWNLVNKGAKPVAARIGANLSEQSESSDESTETTTIYPNPTDGGIIKMSTFVEKETTINVGIYDMTGEVLVSKKYENRIGWVNENIDVNTLKAGFYIFKVNKGGIIETKKMIKL